MRRRKPSDRHKVDLDTPELNLNSMMDLFAVLIPALLMMSAVVEVTMLTVAAPAIDSANKSPPPVTAKPPLNLTVTIVAGGYLLSGEGEALSKAAGAVGAVGAPSIPVIQKMVSCGRFRNTWPPPHARNQAQPRCEDATSTRTFWVYDTAALNHKVAELKEAYPDERRITINAEPNVEYEAVIDVMDATRDVRTGVGDAVKTLFDEVVLSPGVQ